jgi:hypothetical protein
MNNQDERRAAAHREQDVEMLIKSTTLSLECLFVACVVGFVLLNLGVI